MRGRLFLGFLVVAGILFILVHLRSEAELIPHHGEEVEPNGSAADCLACHDDSVAGAVSFCTVGCNFNSSHSVLKPYPPPGNVQEYAPIEALFAAGVSLENGNISCISCHNLHNGARYHLIVDNSDSRLCFMCHRK